MAQFEPVGVTTTVRGFTVFMTRMGRVDRAIRASGVAGATAAVGMGVLNVAIRAVAIGAVAAVAGIIAITAAVAGLGFASIQTAISMEDAFAGVLKTTNGLGTNLFDLTEQGERVFQQFRDLSKEIPLTFEALARIGELGGQLGIPEQQIAKFTETIAALGVSTNLTSEEAALGLARLAAVFKIETDSIAENIERQASAIVFLGNNYAAMEKDILLSSRNIAGSAAIIGFSQADIFGIATAFNIAGVRAEAGGTAVQRALLKIDEEVRNVAKGVPSALDGMARHMGITAQEFAKLWEEDAGTAFVTFVKGLEASGDDITDILEDFDSASARALRTFLGLANSSDVLESAVSDANDAFERNSALTREAEIRFGTLKSQLQIMKNAFRDVALTIGLELAPALQGILDIDFAAFANEINKQIPAAFAQIRTAIERDLEPALRDIGIDIDFDLPSVETVGQFVAGIGEVVSDAITRFSDFIRMIKETKMVLEQDLAAAFQVVSDVWNNQILPILQPLIDAFKNLGDAVSATFPQMGESAMLLGGILLTFFGQTLILLINGVATALNALAEFWRTWGSAIINVVTVMVTIVAGLINGLVQLMIATITNAFTLILAIVTALGQAIMGNWQGALETILTAMLDVLAVMLEAITNIANNIVTLFGTSLGEVEQKFVDTWATIVDSLIDAGIVLVQTIADVGKLMVEEILGIAWNSVGVDIINGIKQGVLDAVDGLIDAVVEAAEKALDAARAFLKAGSPSKVFMEVGKDIVEGMALGIIDNEGIVESAAQSMAARTVQMSIQSLPMQAMGAGSSTDRSFNPTVNANYHRTQSPQDIAGDLVLINAARG